MNKHIERPVELDLNPNACRKARIGNYATLLSFYLEDDRWKYMNPDRMRFVFRRALGEVVKIDPRTKRRANFIFDKLTKVR